MRRIARSTPSCAPVAAAAGREPGPQGVVAQHSRERRRELVGPPRRHEQRLPIGADDLPDAAHVGRDHREPEHERLHHRDGQTFVVGRETEHVECGHDAASRRPGNREARTDRRGRAGACSSVDLRFQGTLPHGDEAHGRDLVAHAPSGREQVRVGLVATQVRDRADDELVGPDAQGRAHLGAGVERRMHGGHVDAVDDHLRVGLQARRHGIAYRAGHRGASVVETRGRRVQRAREARVAAPHVVLGRDDVGPMVPTQCPCARAARRSRRAVSARAPRRRAPPRGCRRSRQHHRMSHELRAPRHSVETPCSAKSPARVCFHGRRYATLPCTRVRSRSRRAARAGARPHRGRGL